MHSPSETRATTYRQMLASLWSIGMAVSLPWLICGSNTMIHNRIWTLMALVDLYFSIETRPWPVTWQSKLSIYLKKKKQYWKAAMHYWYRDFICLFAPILFSLAQRQAHMQDPNYLPCLFFLSPAWACNIWKLYVLPNMHFNGFVWESKYTFYVPYSNALLIKYFQTANKYCRLTQGWRQY